MVLTRYGRGGLQARAVGSDPRSLPTGLQAPQPPSLSGSVDPTTGSRPGWHLNPPAVPPVGGRDCRVTSAGHGSPASGDSPQSLQAALPSPAPGTPRTRNEHKYGRKLAVGMRKRKQRKGLHRPAALNPAPWPLAAAILVRARLLPGSSAGRRGPLAGRLSWQRKHPGCGNFRLANLSHLRPPVPGFGDSCTKMACRSQPHPRFADQETELQKREGIVPRAPCTWYKIQSLARSLCHLIRCPFNACLPVFMDLLLTAHWTRYPPLPCPCLFTPCAN